MMRSDFDRHTKEKGKGEEKEKEDEGLFSCLSLASFSRLAPLERLKSLLLLRRLDELTKERRASEGNSLLCVRVLGFILNPSSDIDT